jgi:hypothetical protein
MRSHCCSCVCVCVCVSPQLTFERLNPSQQPNLKIPPISLCVCMYIPISLLGNGSVR